MAKVMEMVELTLIPHELCSTLLSSDTARMAVPVLVLVVNRVRGYHDNDTGQYGDNGDTGNGQFSVKKLQGPVPYYGRKGFGAGSPYQQGCILQKVRYADGVMSTAREGAFRRGLYASRSTTMPRAVQTIMENSTDIKGERPR